MGLFFRVDYERRGSQFWDVNNSTARSALDFVNARLGLESEDGKWSATATGQNLGDENYNSEWVSGGFSAAAPGRVWNVQFRYNFY